MSRIVNWLLGYDLDETIDKLWRCGNDRQKYNSGKIEQIENVIYKIPEVKEHLFCNDCDNMEVKRFVYPFHTHNSYSCFGMKELSIDNPLHKPMRHDKCPGYKHKEFEMGKFQEVDDCPSDKKPAKKKA